MSNKMWDRLSEEMADKMSATVGITRRKYVMSYVYYNSFLYTISSLCSFDEGVELKHTIEFRASNCIPFNWFTLRAPRWSKHSKEPHGLSKTWEIAVPVNRTISQPLFGVYSLGKSNSYGKHHVIMGYSPTVYKWDMFHSYVSLSQGIFW